MTALRLGGARDRASGAEWPEHRGVGSRKQ